MSKIKKTNDKEKSLTQIVVKGARQHNLKNINVSIPRDKLVVITGLSGSGKSSLAFDTIYAEGQRRYVESLSTYARQFLGLMEKPDMDTIEGLSPAISIEQKANARNRGMGHAGGNVGVSEPGEPRSQQTAAARVQGRRELGSDRARSHGRGFQFRRRV